MRFIDEHRDRFAVALLLRVLDIAESTYYQWVKLADRPCDRDLVDLGLLSNIYEIWQASGCTYGADRVHGQLRRDGIRVGRKRVERLMAAQGWHGAFLRRGWRGGSTRQDPRHTPAPDLVNRQFTADRPNRLWVADATRIPCGEGVFWLAAVRDVFSRRIVGWKTSDRCDTDLILAALEYGIWSRDTRDGELIHHSDRGSNYTSFRFAERLRDNGILPSKGSVGDSYVNALMENVYETAWHAQTEPDNLTPAPTGGR
jgi:putative transposase